MSDASVIVKRLWRWIHDLQSGMYINCVYCGHRYGPSDEHAATIVDDGATPSMQDALKAHIEECPEHPMSQLHAQTKLMQAVVDAAVVLEDSERKYRQIHDYQGGGHIETGIAWDRMRGAGDVVRRELKAYTASSRKTGEAGG